MCVFNHASLECFALLSPNMDDELCGWEHSRFPVLHLTATWSTKNDSAITREPVLDARRSVSAIPVSALVSRAASRGVSKTDVNPFSSAQQTDSRQSHLPASTTARHNTSAPWENSGKRGLTARPFLTPRTCGWLACAFFTHLDSTVHEKVWKCFYLCAEQNAGEPAFVVKDKVIYLTVQWQKKIYVQSQIKSLIGCA